MNFTELQILEQDFKPNPPLNIPSNIRDILENTGLLKGVKPGQTLLIRQVPWD
jgi:hypothetical protein